MARRSEQPRYRSYIRRQPVETPFQQTVDDHLIYGQNDNFPLKLSKLVYESPAASSCISVISDFIEGNGFSTDVGDIVVNNQGQTLNDIHHLVSESLAMYEGFALNVKYNPEGRITQLYFMPFENCRLGNPDSVGIISEIKYNPYFGTNQYKQKSTLTYDTFNPDPAIVVTQMKNKGKDYRGQVLYWGSTRALSRFYPQPSYYSAKNWMEVDARIGEYHKENLRNGFLQSAIFKIVGNPNAPSADPNDTAFDQANSKQETIKTVGESFDEMMSNNFSGTERVGNVMVFWANNKEEFPQVEPFPTSVNTQVLDTIQNLTTKNITIATKVPAILANIHEGVSLGGDGNTIQAAVKLMQQRAAKWQQVLETQYKRILESWYNPIPYDVEIVDHNPFPTENTIDPVIWADLNPETKKKWIQDNTDIEIIEPVQQSQPQVNPTNVLYNSYPDKAKANAVKAMKWNEQSPGQCGTKMGWQMAQQIAEGTALSYKTIKRLNRYLKNNEVHMNKPFNESCNTVLFYAWGGKEMLQWSTDKIKEVEL
jgi:hypothetical protein